MINKPPELNTPLEEIPIKLTVNTTPELMNLPLEFEGYCIYTLVHFNGYTIMGNPNYGVVRFKNAFYVFSSEEALNNFVLNPNYYIQSALELVKKKTELVSLLKLHNQLPDMSIPSIIGKSVFNAADTAQMKDVGTETPVHFIEKFIDHSYEWNEWNLRRKTLQIIRLTKSRTIGMQTDKSHFKQTHDTQHYPTFEYGTQTMRDSATNPIITKKYITGLRGDPKLISNVIEHVRDLNNE